MSKQKPGKWIACETEEYYFKSSLKNSRAERKRLSENDRSKYKKTDQKKQKSSPVKKDGFTGRVLSVSSQGIEVLENETTMVCSLKGALRKEKTKQKNLVIVGDFVQFEKTDSQEGVITAICPRQSILSRADNLSRQKEHLIAANIDQVIITASVVSPPLKPLLIDRYIIASIKGNMQPIVVINKLDLLENKDQEEQKKLLDQCIKAYQAINISVILISTENGTGLDILKQVMKEKASVFSGQSGTGKSSLINAITGLNLTTGKTVQSTNKGSHTTTCAKLIPLETGGLCIDTPGIKSFGVWEIEAQEIQQFFPEISTLKKRCKFADCSHTHEASCAVIEAVKKESVSSLRYHSYLSLLESLDKKHKRR